MIIKSDEDNNYNARDMLSYIWSGKKWCCNQMMCATCMFVYILIRIKSAFYTNLDLFLLSPRLLPGAVLFSSFLVSLFCYPQLHIIRNNIKYCHVEFAIWQLHLCCLYSTGCHVQLNGNTHTKYQCEKWNLSHIISSQHMHDADADASHSHFATIPMRTISCFL